jgi:integrase
VELVDTHVSGACVARHEGSSPSFGTKKPAKTAKKQGIFANESKLWLKSVAQKHPYKLAKLIHHNYNLKKRWYVIFWAYDVSIGDLRRVRLFNPINRQKSVSDRIAVGMAIVDQVNTELQEGRVLGKDDVADIPKIIVNKYTVTEAIDFVRKDKKSTGHRKNYYKAFNTLKTRWEGFIRHENIPDIEIKKLRVNDLFAFFRYLKNELKVENKTYNNYRNYFATVINFLRKLDPKLFEGQNPIINSIDLLPVIVRKHAAFTSEQLQQIIEKCRMREYWQLILYIQFGYYTLARPNEIVRLKIKHIDLERSRIFIPGDISKNKRDEYIGISAHFAKIIRDSGILSYHSDFFVFGSRGVPDEIGYASYQPIWRKNKEILEATELYYLNSNFSLYSYKHSGAIDLYILTKDIKLLQHQCRHTTINQTNTYLRDLGLLHGLDGIKDWKGAI